VTDDGWTETLLNASIKMDLREMEWEGVDWMHLAQDGTSNGLL